MLQYGKCFIQLEHSKGFTTKKLLHALIIENEYDQEILISWDNCILMGIIPENFPYCNMEHDVDPQSDENQNVENKETEEKNKRIAEEMRKKFLKKYSDVFKEKLEKGDKVRCPPVRIETIKNTKVKPINCRVPAPVPAHYRKASDKLIRDFLKAGIIERCHHHTPWLSRSLFVSKKQEEGKELKVRLVADFKDVNMVLKSPNYPNEGSKSLLKQIDPKAQVFCTMGFSHGYYQIEVDKRDRDLFAFVIPQGKYRFCRLAQGSKPGSDLFNIIMDDEIRSIDEAKKNMDDILLAQHNYNLLDPVIDKLLKICRKKNLKLNPSKFKIGNQVDFGGTRLRFSKANNRVQISPSQQKIEELMGKEPPKTKKQLQSVLGSLNQLATWMPQIKSHIPLMRKLSGGNNQFKESEQLNQEFELMKNQLKKTVTLSPLKIGRELNLHTDASNNGLGFILSQPHKDEKKKDYENYNITRNIVTLGSAGL